MRLTRIELENFKGIGERQGIDLRPITMLFGPNSAGKSTILQALHYMREILERGNIDPDKIVAGGFTDLGGFSNLVHNHELDRTISLKLVFALSYNDVLEEMPLNFGFSVQEPKFAELPVRYLFDDDGKMDVGIDLVQEIGLQVDVKWSGLAQSPYIHRFSIDLDGEHLAAIEALSTEKSGHLTDFNFAHPLLRHAVRREESGDARGSPKSSASSPLEDEISTLTQPDTGDSQESASMDGRLKIGIETKQGALPELEDELQIEPGDPDMDDEMLVVRFDGICDLLSEMFLAPARLARDHLKQMTYIGPLREMPTRGFRPQKSPDEARWAQGLAAWDMLAGDKDGGLLEEVNDWLSSEQRLRTPYRLERVEIREIPSPDDMRRMLKLETEEPEDFDGLVERYRNHAPRVDILLHDLKNHILVAPCDVGAGISQMVPVVVATLRKGAGILCMEQPELHIHPAVQVGMGDLFIEAAIGQPDSGKTFLVETHSEHIMLRLLRRVRETTDGELASDLTKIVPDDLSVIHVEKTAEGIRFKTLRVSDDGDFVDRWPLGFFDQRAEELF